MASTPCKLQLQVANDGTGARFGSYSSHNWSLMTNNSVLMTLTTTKRVGINTTGPLADLHVGGTTSTTYAAGGQMAYVQGVASNMVGMTLGPVSYATSIISAGYISCANLVTVSDRKLKKDIVEAELEDVLPLYQLKPQCYSWIESENKPIRECGLIAQEVAAAGLLNLISVVDIPDMKRGADPVLEPEGKQLSVNYPMISMYNMRMIQHLLEEIKELKASSTQALCGSKVTNS